MCNYSSIPINSREKRLFSTLKMKIYSKNKIKFPIILDGNLCFSTEKSIINKHLCNTFVLTIFS